MSTPTTSRWRVRIFATLVVVYLVVTWIAWSDRSHASFEDRLDDHERAGLAVWRRENCQVCHQLYGFGGFLGPDLTNAIVPQRRDVDFATLLTIGFRKMPALHLSPADQASVLAFLRAMNRSGQSLPTPLGPNAFSFGGLPTFEYR